MVSTRQDSEGLSFLDHAAIAGMRLLCSSHVLYCIILRCSPLQLSSFWTATSPRVWRVFGRERCTALLWDADFEHHESTSVPWQATTSLGYFTVREVTNSRSLPIYLKPLLSILVWDCVRDLFHNDVCTSPSNLSNWLRWDVVGEMLLKWRHWRKIRLRRQTLPRCMALSLRISGQADGFAAACSHGRPGRLI